MGQKILGILGGMGPEATINVFRTIVSLTNADNDQDHIELIIHNNTRIPDRTKAILYSGSSPLKELVRSALILEKAGAELLVIPCITAHYYIQDIQQQINIPILNALEHCAAFIENNIPETNTVGILATSGTIKTGLFQKVFTKYDVTCVFPPPDVQEESVMASIYGPQGIKAGSKNKELRRKLTNTIDILMTKGAKAIIAGCTEIPLVLGRNDSPVPFLDPMEIVAQEAVRLCTL